MKTFKIFFILAIFTIFFTTFTKYYPELQYNKKTERYEYKNINQISKEKDYPVLDICIFLDKYKCKDKNCRQWTYYAKGKGDFDPILNNLKSSIMQEEASISCSNLLRELIDSTDKKVDIKKILENLNDKNKWIKFITKDKEFVILIPKNKYPITQKSDLKKIELKKEIVDELDSINKENFYKASEKAQQERILSLPKEIQTAGLIKLETLMDIFTNDSKIIKRIYLAGHGYFQEAIQSKFAGPIKIKKPESPTDTGAAIAQLRPNQYIKFLARLKDIGCSFLYVFSCYSGGWNALACQNAAFYEQENIFKKFETITKDLPFIIVVSSLPDEATAAFETKLISNFFLELHKFLKTETSNFQKLSGNEKSTEIDAITGEGLTIGDKQISLIERKPWLILSIADLLNSLESNKSLFFKNYASIRFPGAPFFRVALKYQQLLENLPEKIRKEYSEMEKKLDPLKKELKKLADKKVWDKWAKKKKEIENIESLFPPLTINYPFLVGHEIKKKKEPIVIETYKQNILIYPSIIDIPIQSKNKYPKIISMISGRAQHYIKEISLTNAIPLSSFAKIFYQHTPTKLYFIETVKGLQGKSTIENFVLKIESKKTDYLYKINNQYFDKQDKKINEKEAKKLIHTWILQTTPAEEAIHEATAGIENIYKIREKINALFGGKLFTKEELSKKDKSKKSKRIEEVKIGRTPEQIVLEEKAKKSTK